MPQKLNLGSGRYLLEGYVNVDADRRVKADIYADCSRSLPFFPGSVEEIRAWHILEHFMVRRAYIIDDFGRILSDWRRTLSTGGALKLAMPDLEALCKEFIKSDTEYRLGLMSNFYGVDFIAGGMLGEHRFGFSTDILLRILTQAGYSHIAIVPDGANNALIAQARA